MGVINVIARDSPSLALAQVRVVTAGKDAGESARWLCGEDLAIYCDACVRTRVRARRQRVVLKGLFCRRVQVCCCVRCENVHACCADELALLPPVFQELTQE